MRIVGVLVLLMLFAGCGDKPRDQAVGIEYVPENIRNIATEKLPGVRFDKAVKRGDGSWELSGRDSRGKVRDIDLSANGEVLEIE